MSARYSAPPAIYRSLGGLYFTSPVVASPMRTAHSTVDLFIHKSINPQCLNLRSVHLS